MLEELYEKFCGVQQVLGKQWVENVTAEWFSVSITECLRCASFLDRTYTHGVLQSGSGSGVCMLITCSPDWIFRADFSNEEHKESQTCFKAANSVTRHEDEFIGASHLLCCHILQPWGSSEEKSFS